MKTDLLNHMLTVKRLSKLQENSIQQIQNSAT